VGGGLVTERNSEISFMERMQIDVRYTEVEREG